MTYIYQTRPINNETFKLHILFIQDRNCDSGSVRLGQSGMIAGRARAGRSANTRLWLSQTSVGVLLNC